VSEAKWLAATSVYELDIPWNLKTKGELRKRRLLGVAWCRRVIELAVPDTRLIQLLEVVERFADGEADAAELKHARKVLTAIRKEVGTNHFGPLEALSDAAKALDYATHSNPAKALSADEPCRCTFAALTRKSKKRNAWYGAIDAEKVVQLHLARCIFGNPFRPVAFSPVWRTESAVALARTAYDTRNFSLLPILADALEEAGCDHADILSHCRDPKGVHARGCWVVDLVLNKS
jgi:hypothetical protein